MNKGLGTIIKVGVSSLLASIYILSGSTGVAAEAKAQVQAPVQANCNWKDFHSVSGRCTMLFPDNPQHISESMNVPEEGYSLKYDAYISQATPKMVYMLLIAQYPDFVDETYARMSLESFLNGILNHNPNNQLIFADLLLVDGHEALDFHIRSGAMYFKGRAMMVKNSLYLMAMECEIPSYDELLFNQFIGSFKLVKN
jgi:hypothetical protein